MSLPSSLPIHNFNSASDDAMSESDLFRLDGAEFSLSPEGFGRLRRELFWTLGETRAHGVLARFGLACGQTDGFHGAEAAPLLRGLGELVRSSTTHGAEEHVFEVQGSSEAEQHRRFFPTPSSAPQCWLMSGYLTGAVSEFAGRPLYVLETECAAKGDATCRFVAKSRDGWTAEGGDLIYYDEDNMMVELAGTREQLRLTKDRYQNLFEQSVSPIFIIDPDTGAYLNANVAAEELTGYGREQLLQMNLFDLCLPQEHNRTAAHLKSLVADHKSVESEISIVRKDGLIRVIAQSSKILTYGGQRVVQCIMRDVTDLKLSAQKERDLQHQLTRSERLSTIGRLAAGVAHELKNPLGAIRNAIYYIRNALHQNPILETDPHLKEIMKLAEEEIDASVVIIGELLDFSRVVQLVPRRTSVNDLLERLLSIVNVPENVQIAWDLDVTLPSASLDPDRLTQVFCNVMTNAIQAMPQGGRLTIRSRFLVEAAGEEGVSQERIVVGFDDTGVGIEPVHLPKIFEPLFTTKARGTGLGLAISNNIVEKHGGVMQATSQIGKGTSFTIKLPLQPPADKEERANEHR